MNDIKHLTHHWILVGNDGDPATLPLTEDFTHTSPYGTINGRERYLEMVIPMAKQNFANLTIEDVLVSGSQSVVRYNNRMAGAIDVPSGDWLEFVDGELARVWSNTNDLTAVDD